MQGKVKEQEKEKFRVARLERGTFLRTVRRLLSAFGWFGAGMLSGMAEGLFGTYPFGFALLCAAGSNLLPILGGLVVSAFLNGDAPVLYICLYSTAAVVRTAAQITLDDPTGDARLPERLRELLFYGNPAKKSDAAGEAATLPAVGFGTSPEEGRGRFSSGAREILRDVFTKSVWMRMIVAAAVTLFLSVWRAAAGGFVFYDFFAALFLIPVAVLAVPLYAIRAEGRIAPGVLRTVSAGALILTVSYASRELLVSGFSLAVMLAFFLTLYASDRAGVTAGAATAALCGVGVRLLYAPGLLLAALVYSLLSTKNRKDVGTAVALLSMLTWVAYTGGTREVLVFLPAGLISGAAFTLTEKIFRERRAKTPEERRRKAPEECRREDAEARFRGISDAFSSLSEMFYNLSDRFRRPGTLDLRQICDEAFDDYCPDCPNKTVCWGLEYTDTLGTVNGLISGLHTKGRVTAEMIPETITRRCASMGQILERVNRDCARLTGEMLRDNRTEIFAMDYEAAASIINDALEEDDGEYRFDTELGKRVSEYLTDAGIRAGSVTVYGSRRRRIIAHGAEVDGAKVSAETLRGDLGEMCGLSLGSPTFEVEHGTITMTLCAKKKIAVTGAQNNVSSDGGVSGDTVNLFSNKKDYFYALISDGMGSGAAAAKTSGLCSVFLEKMLRAGNRAGTSVRMLNNLICSRGAGSADECSSTVDLLELDLMTADATFLKSGAAPSFVVRGKTVRTVRSGTAPIGIIRAVDAGMTTFGLCPGDTVVMISDGILERDPECAWLLLYLAGAGEKEPEEIVKEIVRHAVGEEKHDDCSAVALRIAGA